MSAGDEVLQRIKEAADRAFDANPGKPLTAEITASVRRLLPEPPAVREDAA